METTAEKSYRSSTFAISEDCVQCGSCLNVEPNGLLEMGSSSVLWKANSSRTINVGTDQSGMYMDMVEEGNKICPLECFSEMG